MTFHKRLERLRIAKNLSKAELCRQLKIPQTTYSGYALGTREPDLATIQKLAKYFGVNSNYLITGEDTNQLFENKYERLIDQFLTLNEEDKKTIEDLIRRMTQK